MHKMLPYGMVLKLCLLTVGCLMSVLADTSSDSTRSEISSSSSSSGHRRFSYKHGSWRGPPGPRGPEGPPGICPSFCSDACVFGARGILEQTKIDERGVLTIDSLGEAVEQGNMTARWIEAGELEVGDLDETQANELYVYLMFKNSICDMSLLRALSPGTPDILQGEPGEPGPKGEKGQKGEKGCVGPQGNTGVPGEMGVTGATGPAGQKGEMGDTGEKGDMGDPGPVGDTGVPGPVGPTGTMGPSGPPGPPGVTATRLVSGTTYTNWGEATCPPGVSRLYRGTVVQTISPGGALQCLQDQALARTHSVPSSHLSSLRTLTYASDFKLARPVPCALCYVPNRSAQFLNLGAGDCPRGWTREVAGALATVHREFFSDSVCVSQSLLTTVQWKVTRRGMNDLNLVRTQCDSKQCVKGQVSCAVCTK